MSYWDDFCPDPFDGENDDWDGYFGPSGGYTRKTKACIKCGHKPLVWNEVRPGVFRLYDQQLGKLHQCPPALDFK